MSDGHPSGLHTLPQGNVATAGHLRSIGPFPLLQNIEIAKQIEVWCYPQIALAVRHEDGDGLNRVWGKIADRNRLENAQIPQETVHWNP